MDNWDDLRFLVALSRTGTMTAAAKMLGTNTATVSRRIERLSETLGEPAFVKTAHGWKPSTSVARLIDLAQTFDGELQTALNSREPSEGSQQVPVNIGCPPFVTSQVLIPNMSTETETLSVIGLTFNDRLLREGLGEHDIVVQLGTPDSGRVVTRKAGSILFNMFTKRGSSAETNRWIGLSEMFDQAPVMTMGRDMFDTQPAVRVENFAAIFSLIHVTAMHGPLPEIMAAASSELEYSKPGTEPFEAEFWIMFHETRRSDPVIRRVVDWIMDAFVNLDELQRRHLKNG
ncbi:LysR family transcriptional regulator [Roseivivax sp. THAF30]|uniref:LysR family transcriptional regulator n=1 Tax=Roseivivax sp. THAF30 TaxID=2587852 RepID=UPI0012695C82|nr:LysR family transcriptional regulator [Roseivivax sp. THAF30]QFT63805.1 Bacterial regulatory helix-turn-helix protein, lysR family [Roseivivax sp. THAF30]